MLENVTFMQGRRSRKAAAQCDIQMPLDPPTLLVMMMLAIFITSGSYFIVWLQDRQQRALLWMTAASLLSVVAFAGRFLLPPAPAVMLSNPGILVAVGCVWMGCRLLGGRRWLPWALILPSMAWVGLCYVPAFMAHSGVRVAVLSLLLAPMFGMAAREIWRLGGGNQVARWWVFSILAIESLGCLGQGLWYALWPGVNQVSFESFRNFAFVTLSSQGFALLIAFAMIALVKEQTAQQDRLAAAIDALTGLANRRHLDEALEPAVQTAQLSGRPLALIMVDVDSFKGYNDLYGHQQGDICLRAIAGALGNGMVRKLDLVARYGGEEFAVLLPDTDAAAAERIAERLRLAVRELGLRHAGRKSGIVTISLGVAVLAPGHAITSAAGLLRAADQALYRAKRLGRDRTVSHTDAEFLPAPAVATAARAVGYASS